MKRMPISILFSWSILLIYTLYNLMYNSLKNFYMSVFRREWQIFRESMYFHKLIISLWRSLDFTKICTSVS